MKRYAQNPLCRQQRYAQNPTNTSKNQKFKQSESQLYQYNTMSFVILAKMSFSQKYLRNI